MNSNNNGESGVARRSVSRLGAYVAGVAGLVTFLAGGVAFAADDDPTGGVFDTAKGDLTTTIIPAAAALIVVGIVFAVAVKWMGKAMKKG